MQDLTTSGATAATVPPQYVTVQGNRIGYRAIGQGDSTDIRAQHLQPRVGLLGDAARLVAPLETEDAIAALTEIDRPARYAAARIHDQPLLGQVREHRVVDELDLAVGEVDLAAFELPPGLTPLDRAQRIEQIDLVAHERSRP